MNVRCHQHHMIRTELPQHGHDEDRFVTRRVGPIFPKDAATPARRARSGLAHRRGRRSRMRSDIAAPLELITQASPARRYTRKGLPHARGAVDVEVENGSPSSSPAHSPTSPSRTMAMRPDGGRTRGSAENRAPAAGRTP